MPGVKTSAKRRSFCSRRQRCSQGRSGGAHGPPTAPTTSQLPLRFGPSLVSMAVSQQPLNHPPSPPPRDASCASYTTCLPLWSPVASEDAHGVSVLAA